MIITNFNICCGSNITCIEFYFEWVYNEKNLVDTLIIRTRARERESLMFAAVPHLWFSATRRRSDRSPRVRQSWNRASRVARDPDLSFTESFVLALATFWQFLVSSAYPGTIEDHLGPVDFLELGVQLVYPPLQQGGLHHQRELVQLRLARGLVLLIEHGHRRDGLRKNIWDTYDNLWTRLYGTSSTLTRWMYFMLNWFITHNYGLSAWGTDACRRSWWPGNLTEEQQTAGASLRGNGYNVSSTMSTTSA